MYKCIFFSFSLLNSLYNNIAKKVHESATIFRVSTSGLSQLNSPTHTHTDIHTPPVVHPIIKCFKLSTFSPAYYLAQ